MNSNNINSNSSNSELITFTDLSPKNFSAVCRTKLAALKNSLVQKFTREFGDIPTDLVRHAVDEADALASLTFLPHLLLPTLAEEKVQSLHEWAIHQRAVSSQLLYAEAA